MFSPSEGTGTGAAELLAIGGDADNVFEVAEFDLLDGKVAYCCRGAQMRF